MVVGGHTVQDDEPKFGLSVTGIVHPDKVLKNYGCKEGDVLVLTKPLGVGIVNTAIKGGIASETAYNKAVKNMATLNKYSGEIAVKYDINACTDITGFGIMGHGYEMAEGSKVTLKLWKDSIPYIEEAKEYASMGLVPEGAYNNRAYLQGKYELIDVEQWMEDILFDPQTSGGLLLSLSKEQGQKLLEELKENNVESWIIGEAVAKKDKYIIVE